MQIYLVGGAVRDALLGLPVGERDWVVVGATPEAMLARGYRPVGRHFPVFLHPDTGEEYALARTERKTGPGYHGFVFQADPGVTLEQDLARRDLTINAMARSAEGRLIDPCGGRADLAARRLRHVGPAFVEDPVRVLRLARFAARFAELGFAVAPETRALAASMVEAGEVDALVAERVWAETERALGGPDPARYIEELRACGALARLLPEVERLFGVPQRPEHHPEIDTGAHTLMVLRQAAALSPEAPLRFAALVHDLGKGATDPALLPRHPGHEARGAELLARLSERLRVPRAWSELAMLATRYHTDCHRALELGAEALLELLEHTDALRRPQRFEDFLCVCEADSRGRGGYAEHPYPQRAWLRSVRDAAAAVQAAPLLEAGQRGAALAAALRDARLQAIAALQPPQG